MTTVKLADAEVWTAINGLRAGADYMSTLAHDADMASQPVQAEALRQSGRAYKALADKIEESYT